MGNLAVFLALSILTVFICAKIADPLVSAVSARCFGITGDMAACGVLIAGELVYSALLFIAVRTILKNRLNLE